MKKTIGIIVLGLLLSSNAYAAKRMLFYKVMVVNYETRESFKTKYYIKLDSATITGKDSCKLKTKSKIKEACLLSHIWVISGKVKNVHDRGYQLTFGANKEKQKNKIYLNKLTQRIFLKPVKIYTLINTDVDFATHK